MERREKWSNALGSTEYDYILFVDCDTSVSNKAFDYFFGFVVMDIGLQSSEFGGWVIFLKLELLIFVHILIAM